MKFVWRWTAFSIVVFCVLSFVNCSNPESESPRSTPETQGTLPLEVKSLSFPGVGSGGIFDPSVTRDPSTGKLWMSYSTVDNSVLWPTQNPISVHIRLASSSDNGETWVDAGAVNQFKDVDLSFLPPPLNAGTWVHETSSLIFDPAAAANQKWKLIWQTVLKINGTLYFEHSWLSYKSGSSPQELLNAATTKLMTSYLYDVNNSNPASPTLPPLTTIASIRADTEISSTLNKCIIAEPSFYATAGFLYLALQCEKFNSVSDITDRDRWVVLLKCASPCNVTNAASWIFVNKIFSKSDSAAVDPKFNGFAAPAIAETATGVYLLVTPTEDAQANYRGCRVYKFSDLSTGQIETENGSPKLFASTGPTSTTFNGACAYIGGSVSGILRSHLGQDNPPWDFRVLLTRITF
ncbi:MAG: exo-alpha-sialidase [Deltaproteobacteria bacterium]|jgi:hypothetical protein|nr:exo-alpha-sialidase [Deltaproteobacteria bacterium]